ncbi:MAG: IS701 family transposase [Planctomycetaceae bacterium]|nr:IS701 family transposase [Planctomycetaceae bacterium]
MSLLDHPEAQALLADATVTPDQVRGCQDRLTAFLERYLPCFYRVEQRTNAALVIRGLLSGLQRKTCEPIAVEAGVHRKPVQFFVGAGKWDDEDVMAELRRDVREALGNEQAILVLDPSAFPKSGTESCGVARQGCGRLGKQDNCQLGVFLIYATPGGYAPLDRRLYLPKEWATDPDRRKKTHVPADVTFQEAWRLAVDLLERCRKDLPHAWVTGDDELGRPAEFRGWLRRHGERYILDGSDLGLMLLRHPLTSLLMPQPGIHHGRSCSRTATNAPSCTSGTAHSTPPLLPVPSTSSPSHTTAASPAPCTPPPSCPNRGVSSPPPRSHSPSGPSCSGCRSN